MPGHARRGTDASGEAKLAEAVRGVADPIASIRETSWILV